jgi:hypothetical protein
MVDSELNNAVKKQIGIGEAFKNIMLKRQTILQLNEKQIAEREAIKKVSQKIPPPKNKVITSYKNEYDEQAHFIIQFCTLLSKDEFATLPDLDAKTVYYIIQRMSEVDRYNTDCSLELNQLQLPASKEIKTRKEWMPYIEEFNRLIENGESVSKARTKIGNMIEKVNKVRINKKEKPICTKSTRGDGNSLCPTARPDKSTLCRQLVTNRK